MIIQKLKNFKEFTYQEQNIAKYILEHPDSVLTCNAKELAKQSYSSSSTIVRLCKKLNFQGYPDFQKCYIKEYNQFQDYYAIDKVISIKDIYAHIIAATDNNIDTEVINYIVKKIKEHNKIDFFASDINYSICETMCFKLNTLGIHGKTFNSLNNIYLKSMKNSQHLSLIISHSGANETLINIIKDLKTVGIKPISISSPYNNTIRDLCYKDIPIFYEPNFPHRTLQYTLSVQYILDIIYMQLSE